MIYGIGVFLVFFYTFLYLLLDSETYFFGLNYIAEFLTSIILFIFDKPFNLPYFDLNIEEIEKLKIGMYINIVFFVVFILISLTTRFHNLNMTSKETKTKRFFGWIIFMISMMTLFSSINNYSEILRQENYYKHIESMSIKNNGYVLTLNNQLKIKTDSGIYEDIKNKKLIIEKEGFKIEIKALKIANFKEYNKILISRYSYNLKIKKEKLTKFKQKESFVVEYLINKDYNRDYIIRGDEVFFVISFKSIGKKDKKSLNKFRNFLISSIYLNGRNKL